MSGLFVLGACQGSSGGGGPSAPDARPRADAAPGADGSGNPDEPDAAVDPAEALWRAISGGNDYKRWPGFPGYEGVAESAAHGTTHRRVFVNDAAAADLAGLPSGSILVKENLTSATETDLAAITVMQKKGDTWFWASFKTDGTAELSGTTEELAGAGCVAAGCHGDQAGAQSDFVFLNNHAQTAAEAYVEMSAGEGYTAWTTFGDEAPVVNRDNTAGLHGGAYLRSFINETAEGNERNLPEGSLLVLENLSVEDPATANALATLTVMLKIRDIDPDNDDWLYARLGADGKVQFAGTRSENNADCAGGACHGNNALTGGDFVFGN